MFAMPNQTLAWSPAHGRGGRSTKSWALNSNVMSSPMLGRGGGSEEGHGGERKVTRREGVIGEVTR